MFADLLSNFYTQHRGYLAEIDYMSDFNFESENNTFSLIFDHGDMSEEAYPVWILQDSETSNFDGVYVEFSTQELIDLQQVITKALEALQSYEQDKFMVKRINV